MAAKKGAGWFVTMQFTIPEGFIYTGLQNSFGKQSSRCTERATDSISGFKISAIRVVLIFKLIIRPKYLRRPVTSRLSAALVEMYLHPTLLKTWAEKLSFDRFSCIFSVYGIMEPFSSFMDINVILRIFRQSGMGYKCFLSTL